MSQIWNSIPSYIKNAESLHLFKSNYDPVYKYFIGFWYIWNTKFKFNVEST